MHKIFKHILVISSIFVISIMGAKAETSVWDGSASRWVRGNGTEQAPFLIDSASHLAYLAQAVSAGSIFADTFFVLTINIDLQHLPWTPIGCNANSAFMGKFNGNQYVIKNMNCIDTIFHSGPVYIGLFGYTLDAHIFNICLSGQNEVLASFSSSYNLYIGGIVGYAFASLIEYCTFEGNVSAYAVSSHAYVGGILAYSASGTNVNHCVNKGKVYASSQGVAYGGGILADCDNTAPVISHCHNEGYVYATGYTYAYAGGIAAKLNYGAAIHACFNTGKIETYSNSNTYAGGIAGLGSACSITSSFNEGTLEAIGYDYAYGGGIVGFTEHSSTISDCYNRGDIISNSYYQKSYVGGIVGHIYNYAFMPTLVSSCYQTGNLFSISSFRAFSGGIAGEIVNNATFSQCYYLNSSILDPSNTSGTAVDAVYLRAFSTVDSLNQSNQLWAYDEAYINMGYPLLLYCGASFVITDVPDIQMTVITLKARVIERADSVCQRGFAYKKQNELNFTYILSDTGNVFQTRLYSLEADSQYVYKAFAVLQKDTVYGKIVLFSLGSVSVQTLAVSELEPHAVCLNGSLYYGKDSILTKGFQWKAVSDTAYTSLAVTYTYFSAALTTIKSNTSYMYRAYAVTVGDTVFGNIVYFFTPIQKSVVITEIATELTPYAGNLHASVVYGDDSVLYRGFEWKLSTAVHSHILLLTDTAFVAPLSNLLPNTNYMYRAFIITTTDTIYGVYMAFTTLQSCVLTTYAASMVDMHFAVLHGNIKAGDEQVYMQGFAWRKLTDTTDFLVQVQGIDITDTLFDLQPNTDYIYRVFVVTSNGIFYGNDIFFTTLQYTSDVITLDATDIDVESVVLHGQVTQGEESILMQGFEWKQSKATNYNIRQVEGSTISDTLRDLQPKTTYHFRAFIIIASGTMYGETLSFTTLEDTKIPVSDRETKPAVFPNPATDYLVLKTDEACIGSWIEMYDIYGKRLLTDLVQTTSTRLDVSAFADGVYFLQLKKGNKIAAVVKIVKY